MSFAISFGWLLFLFGLSNRVLCLDLRVVFLDISNIWRLILGARLFCQHSARVRRGSSTVSHLKAFLWHGWLGHKTRSFIWVCHIWKAKWCVNLRLIVLSVVTWRTHCGQNTLHLWVCSVSSTICIFIVGLNSCLSFSEVFIIIETCLLSLIGTKLNWLVFKQFLNQWIISIRFVGVLLLNFRFS